jgi:uncharacterized protein (TIGR02722 family)
MKNKIILSFIAVVPFVIGGCATDAHYVQTGDKEQIINAGQINIQDYANAANAALQDMLHPPNNAPCVLDRVANPPAVIFISRIINNTGQHIDIELPLLTTPITKALLDSGKAVTTSTDPKTIGLHHENEFLNDQKTERLPDFTLSGNIIEHIDRAGNTSRHSYSFQLSLNDTKTGYQVWQGEKQISKQGTRPAVGF